MRRITETLALLLAPILAFTADETWEHLGNSESVHLQPFPEVEESYIDADSVEAVNQLLKARATIQQSIEKARQEKLIGAQLEAEVELTLPAQTFNHEVFND